MTKDEIKEEVIEQKPKVVEEPKPEVKVDLEKLILSQQEQINSLVELIKNKSETEVETPKKSVKLETEPVEKEKEYSFRELLRMNR